MARRELVIPAGAIAEGGGVFPIPMPMPFVPQFPGYGGPSSFGFNPYGPPGLPPGPGGYGQNLLGGLLGFNPTNPSSFMSPNSQAMITSLITPPMTAIGTSFPLQIFFLNTGMPAQFSALITIQGLGIDMVQTPPIPVNTGQQGTITQTLAFPTLNLPPSAQGYPGTITLVHHNMNGAAVTDDTRTFTIPNPGAIVVTPGEQLLPSGQLVPSGSPIVTTAGGVVVAPMSSPIMAPPALAPSVTKDTDMDKAALPTLPAVPGAGITHDKDKDDPDWDRNNPRHMISGDRRGRWRMHDRWGRPTKMGIWPGDTEHQVANINAMLPFGAKPLPPEEGSTPGMIMPMPQARFNFMMVPGQMPLAVPMFPTVVGGAGGLVGAPGAAGGAGGGGGGGGGVGGLGGAPGIPGIQPIPGANFAHSYEAIEDDEATLHGSFDESLILRNRDRERSYDPMLPMITRSAQLENCYDEAADAVIEVEDYDGGAGLDVPPLIRGYNFCPGEQVKIKHHFVLWGMNTEGQVISGKSMAEVDHAGRFIFHLRVPDLPDGVSGDGVISAEGLYSHKHAKSDISVK